MAEHKQSPLHKAHLALDAKMVPFGGWDMPLSYPSGTVAEHLRCRNDAVMFDVSHLGTIQIDGSDAFGKLQTALSNDLQKITAGRTQYTHLLNDDGGVEDDIIVWWIDADTFHIMPNASNTARVVGALGSGTDITTGRAIIAVQGPMARRKLATVSDIAANVVRRTVEKVSILDIDCIVAGTGYTGEDGVEIAVPSDMAERVWNALLGAEIQPSGLGARDTLRLEAGLPLHGHELGPTITPLEAGLDWVVAWNKPTFRGREALLHQRTEGVKRKLVAITTQGRRPLRESAQVISRGEVIGMLTSGNYSPVLNHGIGLGFIDASFVGDEVEIDIRGSVIPARIIEPPFVPHRG